MTSLAMPSEMFASSSRASLQMLLTTPAVSVDQTAAQEQERAAKNIVLPKLRIPTESEVRSVQHRYQYQPQREAPQQPWQIPAQQQQYPPLTPSGEDGKSQSPSSPSSFFQQSETKFALAHLLEAAQQAQQTRTVGGAGITLPPVQTNHQHVDRRRSNSYDLPSLTHRMQSIGYQMEQERACKRARSSYELLGSLPRQRDLQHIYQEAQSLQPPTHQSHVRVVTPLASSQPVHEERPVLMGSASPSRPMEPNLVWETVLASGNFPPDICLSETTSSPTNQSSVEGAKDSENLVKQGRWTCDEKEFAEALIQSVRNGETVLPANVSMRKFIADSLQCKAMRVSKKFRSLRVSSNPDGGESPVDSEPSREEHFNALSLRSIMNNEQAAASSEAYQQHPRTYSSLSDSSSPKKGGRVLKRSDYSQHGMVRSGRWSPEEETYAKAMIEAFKSGYLPLHGNVSLRKFLSEVLVCHPMRISKKFVGYVRKYHWYRIAAGKCDPDARRRALDELCRLERIFWTSLQQTNEWTANFRPGNQV